MPIRVAIDSGPLSSGHAIRGIGVMVREEIQAIQQLKDKSISLDPFDFSTNYKKLKVGSYDIVHYTSFFPYTLTLPQEKFGRKEIVTIQDLIYLVYPDKYPPGIRGKINFIKQKQRLKNVDAVLTISETSKKDIVRFLNIPSEKVYVVYLAQKNIFKPVNDKKVLEKVKKKYNLPEKFALYVGDVNYNKNIPTLIEACELAKIPLVIVGKHAKDVENMDFINLMSMSGPQDWMRFLFNKPHPEIAHYSKLLEKFGTKNSVYRLGFVSDEDINEVYNLASVYIQPSYYEGFGLPVLEAMASGIPVIISKTNSLVEIANGAALVADPNSANEIGDAINQILDNKNTKEILIKKGRERIKDFSWEKAAKEIIEVYKNL